MILVTGATGFLGSELVLQLHKQGKKVRALKRESSVIPPILKNIKAIEWYTTDLLDYFSLEKAFEDISHVFHCAAYISFQAGEKKNMVKVNKEGTAHIVNLCLQKGVAKLLHVSSVAALGESKKGASITEKDHWEFDGTQHGYSISKYESEMEVWRGIAEGLKAVIVNPSLIIGKSAGNSGSGKIFETVSKGLKVYTTGSCGLIDVEDVVRAMILLMYSPVSDERFILNAENLSYKDIFSETARCLGIRAPSIKARPWMLELAWRGASVASALSGRKYELTQDTARSSFKQLAYSSSKFLKQFPDFQFKPVRKTIEEICLSLRKV